MRACRFLGAYSGPMPDLQNCRTVDLRSNEGHDIMGAQGTQTVLPVHLSQRGQPSLSEA